MADIGTRTSIEWHGIEDACSIYDKVPKDVMRAAYTRGVAAMCAVLVPSVEQSLRSMVHVDNPNQHKLRGALLRRLKSDIVVDEEHLLVIGSINFGNMSYIANFLEYGHRMVGHKPKGLTKKKWKKMGQKELGFVRAFPFMRPAGAKSAEPAIDACAEAVVSELYNTTTWSDIEASLVGSDSKFSLESTEVEDE